MKYSKKIDCILKEGKKCRDKIGIIGPTGPTGSTGPTGPALTTAYGSKYNLSNNMVALTANVESVIPLDTTGVINNVIASIGNALEVIDAGVYKIDYRFSGMTASNETLTLAVTQNGEDIQNTVISDNFTANSYNTIVGSAIVTLYASDDLGLTLKSANSVNVVPADNVNAYLNIVKLN